MKRSIFFILVILLIIPWVSSTAHAEFLWAKQAGSLNSDEHSGAQGWGIAVDVFGGIIITGRSGPRVTFDGVRPPSSSDTNNIFLAKYAQNGRLLWARTAGGDGNNWSKGVATDSNSNIVITGFFHGSANFGGIRFPTTRTHEAFVAKYDPGGGIIWVRRSQGSSGWNSGNDVAIDTNNHVVVTGRFGGTTEFDGTRLSVEEWPQLFIAKYDAEGRLLWVHQSHSPSTVSGESVATDSENNILVTGLFGDTTDFGGTSLTSGVRLIDGTHVFDIFVAKYTSDGRLLWARQAGVASPSTLIAPHLVGHDITIDSNDNILVTGKMSETTDFDGHLVTSAGYADIFIAKYTPSGNLLWVNRAGGVGVDAGHGIATDKRDNILVTGEFRGTASFDEALSVTSAGGRDIFVAKYAPDGRFLWVRTAGGRAVPGFDWDSGYALSTDKHDQIFLTGGFGEIVNFSGTCLVSRGRGDAFVAKMGTGFDRCEPNERADTVCNVGVSWEHQHARCPIWSAGVDGECSGIFENGFFVPFHSEESWTLDLQDLSLHSADDQDFYKIAIPDPTEAVYGRVHADIRPVEERAASPGTLSPFLNVATSKDKVAKRIQPLFPLQER